MKTDKLTIRIDSKKAAVIRKAAKLEERSVNTFMITVSVEAAKARLAVEKIRPATSGFSEEASA